WGVSNWQIVEPNPIPWLKDDVGADDKPLPLRLVHPAEWDLIAQIVDLLDATGALTQVNWVKRGMALSQAFEEFYRNCRIWGEVMNQDPKLAQARLGLVGMTQIVVRSLLQDQLELFSPVEL
ncbi:DALR anticodon-binding domain-containing protein, partial [Coleofasciculus sp. LEGE 07081]